MYIPNITPVILGVDLFSQMTKILSLSTVVYTIKINLQISLNFNKWFWVLSVFRENEKVTSYWAW